MFSLVAITEQRFRTVHEQWIIQRLSPKPKRCSQKSFDKDFMEFVESEIKEITDWLKSDKKVEDKDALVTIYHASKKMNADWRKVARKQIEKEFSKRNLIDLLQALDFGNFL